MKIENLNINRAENYLYKNFNIEFEKGKVTCILAPSGCGKTTLLDWISGTLDLNASECSGKITFLENAVSEIKNQKISYIFQESRLLNQLSVLENVMLPLKNIYGKSNEKDAENRAVLYLNKTGLSEKINSKPNHLSGGEKQRVNVARAFSYPSDILLMDEPFQSQDLQIKRKLMETVKNLISEENRTVIFVTHDIDEALFLADRIVVLKGRPNQIALDKKVSEVSRKTLETIILDNN